MKQSDLPDRWQTRLQTYLSQIGVTRGHLSDYEFRDHLKLSFDDGSFAFFYFAVALEARDLKEVAVFTENRVFLMKLL